MLNFTPSHPKLQVLGLLNAPKISNVNKSFLECLYDPFILGFSGYKLNLAFLGFITKILSKVELSEQFRICTASKTGLLNAR